MNLDKKEKNKIKNVCSKNGGSLNKCCDKHKLNNIFTLIMMMIKILLNLTF